MAVLRPVGQRRHDADAVEALLLAQLHVFVQAGVRTDGATLAVVAQGEAPRRHGPPGVAEQEEGSSVCVLEAAPIRRRLDHAPAVGVLGQLGVGPGNGVEATGLAVEPGVVLVAAAGPMPLAGRGGQHAHNEGVAAIPKTVDPLVEAGARKVDPDNDVGVGVVIGVGCGEADLQLLPGVDEGVVSHGRFSVGCGI